MIVGEGSVLSMGVYLTSTTPIVDRRTGGPGVGGRHRRPLEGRSERSVPVGPHPAVLPLTPVGGKRRLRHGQRGVVRHGDRPLLTGTPTRPV